MKGCFLEASIKMFKELIKPFVWQYRPCSRCCRIRRLHCCKRVKTTPNEVIRPWMETRDASRRALGGWAVRYLTTKVVTWPAKLHFGHYWGRPRGPIRSIGRPYDFLERILQSALVANIYQTLFYREGTKKRWLWANLSKIAILETI